MKYTQTTMYKWLQACNQRKQCKLPLKQQKTDVTKENAERQRAIDECTKKVDALTQLLQTEIDEITDKEFIDNVLVPIWENLSELNGSVKEKLAIIVQWLRVCNLYDTFVERINDISGNTNLQLVSISNFALSFKSKALSYDTFIRMVKAHEKVK